MNKLKKLYDMKFEVLSSDLQCHLAACARVLNSKNPLPALNDFLFSLKDDSLSVTASDGDTTIIAHIPVHDVEGEVRFLVPASSILPPLANMPTQSLVIYIAENFEVTVTYSNGKFSFLGAVPDAYPERRSMEGKTNTFSMESLALAAGIQSTLFAVSTDDLRIIMNGILFDIMPECVNFVSSDSKRLVKVSNTGVKSDITARFVMPKKSAVMLKNLIGKESFLCEIVFNDNLARITLNNFELDCRFIEGRYPNYNAVIPRNNDNVLIASRSALTSVLRRISAFSNVSTNQVRFDIEENSILLSAQDVDYSRSGSEQFPCSYDDTPMAVGLRADFVIECLNTLNSEEVEIRLSDPARAVLLSPVKGNENEEVLMLLMPMMLVD